MSDSLWPHEPQYVRLPCLSPTSGDHPNPCPLCWWCHPTISSSVDPSPPTFNLSQHQGISNESVLHIRWPKYWSLSFSISPSIEHSRLISFRIDWFDLLAVWRILKSLLQHHSSRTSILQPSDIFIVQLSHMYMTTGKTIALIIWIFFTTVMSLLFNILSRFVIAFLPRNKSLLTSWLQSLSTVILEPKKIKSVTVSIVSPSICREGMGPDAMILVFWMLSWSQLFLSPLSPWSRGSLIPLPFLP